MTLSESPALLKKFRKTPWKFQQTFIPPHRNLQNFVAEVVSACHPCQLGCLTMDYIASKPENLIRLLESCSISPQYGHGWSITAEGKHEMEAVLYAAFCDMVDFIFVPKSTPFAIFGDHDEFATFYAHTRSNLNRVVEELTREGFESVLDYQRPRPHR